MNSDCEWSFVMPKSSKENSWKQQEEKITEDEH